MREGFAGHDGKNLAMVHESEMGSSGSGGAGATPASASGGGTAEGEGDDDGNGGGAEIGEGEPARDSGKRKKKKKSKERDTQKKTERKRKPDEGGGGSASSGKRRKGGDRAGDNADQSVEVPSESDDEGTLFRRGGGGGAGGMSDAEGDAAGDGGGGGPAGGNSGGGSGRDGSKGAKPGEKRRRSAPFKAHDAFRVYKEEKEEGRQNREELIGVFKNIASSIHMSGGGGQPNPAGGAAVSSMSVTLEQKNLRVQAARQGWVDAKAAREDEEASSEDVAKAWRAYQKAQTDLLQDA